jgi:putative membrane protein
MSNTDVAVVREKSLAKGLIAGLIGGLIATAAKTFAERVFPPRTHGEPEPSEVLSERVAGHKLSPAVKTASSEAIHWGFGATVGAAYGVIAEYHPAATAKEGASFGLALGTLTHEGALPAMGLSAEPEDQTFRERSSEMTSHVVYGVVTETVRRLVRKLL